MEIQYEKTKIMFGQWLSNMLFSIKRMFRFIHGQREESGDYGTLSRWDRLTEEKELSKLLSFETIKAKTFYQVQKNLSQIAKEQENLKEIQPEKLSQEIERIKKAWAETMNLLGTAKEQYQQERWKEIVEKYYRAIDNSSFEVFLKGQKKDVEWDCDLAIMQAGYTLASLGVQEGWEALEGIGIKAKDLKQVQQKIRGKITNHELKKKVDPKETEPTDFFVMLARVRKEGYHIDSEILLPEWIGTLKDIKQSNERNNTKI